MLELERGVRDGRRLWEKLGAGSSYKIDFRTDFPAEGAIPDLVFFGSSLQYFPDYGAVIDQTVATGADYILFSNSLIGDIKTHCSLQVNINGTGMAVWKINLDEFLDRFKDKYRLI